MRSSNRRALANIALASLFLSLTACGGGGGSEPETSTPVVATPPAETNGAPTVTLESPAEVVSGKMVTLTATAEDSDGTIESYTWEQTDGTAVEMSNNDSDEMSFTAPEVTEDESIIFTITVTDNDGAEASETTSIMVHPQPVPVVYTMPLDGIIGDIVSITIHPEMPDIALASSIPVTVGQEGTGMYFTEDRGETWSLVSEDFASFRMNYSPTRPTMVVATTPNDYKADNEYTYGISTDYGKTWNWIPVTDSYFGNPLSFRQIDFDPLTHEELWATSPNAFEGGYYMQPIDQSEWMRLPIEAEQFYDEIVQTPADPDQLIFVAGANDEPTMAALKSINNGSTTTTIINSLPIGAIGTFGQTVLVDDANANVIYINGYLSQDGGATYTESTMKEDLIVHDGVWYEFFEAWETEEDFAYVRKTTDYGQTFETVITSEELGFEPTKFPSSNDDIFDAHKLFIVSDDYIYFYDPDTNTVKGVANE